MTDPESERGLYGKFRIMRVDGSSGAGGKHEHCPFFALDPVHDFHARRALAGYANDVADEYPQLSRDLFDLLRGLPPQPVVDQVPRPTADGRPDAVPPLVGVEAVLGFVQYIAGQLGSRTNERLRQHAIDFCEREGLGVPRRGWQQLVKPAERSGR